LEADLSNHETYANVESLVIATQAYNEAKASLKEANELWDTVAVKIDDSD